MRLPPPFENTPINLFDFRFNIAGGRPNTVYTAGFALLLRDRSECFDFPNLSPTHCIQVHGPPDGRIVPVIYFDTDVTTDSSGNFLNPTMITFLYQARARITR
jgi:hypothetical protein